MKKALTWLIALALVLGIAYSAGIGFYAEKFQANSSFGSVDISNLTLEEAKARISDELAKEEITITENGQTLGTFTLAQLNGQVDIDQVLTQAYQSQDPSQWITGYFSSVVYDNLLLNHVTIDDADLTAALASLGLNNSERTPAKDASIQYSDAQGYYVEDEQAGNQLDLEKVKTMIVQGLQEGSGTVEINTAYMTADITSQDESIQAYMDQIDLYANTVITLEIAGNEVTIPKEEILKWIHFDGSNQIVVDRELVMEYLKTLNDQYATYNKSREFTSTLQGTVTVAPGTLGWSIDREAETEQIIADLQAGQDVKREPVIVGTGYNTDGDDIGNTYVEVDIANQMMYVYQNGQQVIATPIVTGRSGTADTVPGAYSIWNKEENAVLRGFNVHTQRDYEQPVSYWMPFDDTGQGIHDASWQSSFGGDAYLSAGSLGCINTPPDVMAQLFSIVEVGTPVIVF
ncbi:TPA: peptidoglycan binding domain-containing protein [Streptococcus suis]